jgi:hypothetical protein
MQKGSSWLWSYCIWTSNYLCNQCLSPLMLRVRTTLRRGVFDTTLCNKVCQWLATGQWFSPGTTISSTNKTDRHDITEKLLKVTLITINLNQTSRNLELSRQVFCFYVYIGWYECCRQTQRKQTTKRHYRPVSKIHGNVY